MSKFFESPLNKDELKSELISELISELMSELSEHPDLNVGSKWSGPGITDLLKDRLATTGVFQNTVVNIDYSDFKGGVVKRVLGAPLTRIGSDYIELSSPIPFLVLTFLAGVVPLPSMELVSNIIIPLSSVLDVRSIQLNLQSITGGSPFAPSLG